ncbi:hypothetical protein [Domibacillus aminovorans]|uniref:DUF4352 domain-containing protein n=1 Tax=Domibacillus aminovorans TaxID=29332 RepID=A0A177L0K4_9BACI|nr:hypothetical protein [Domibacillus aminovorans]OAH59169.1 hypothetical protein AWH49_18655 [Domibacillus aminovorans]
MKNKLGLSALTLLLNAGLAACSDDTEPGDPPPIEESETKELATTKNDNKDDPNTITDETVTYKTIKKSKATEPITSGPFTLSLQSTSSSAEFTGETAEFYGIKNINYVQVIMDIAHTTEATDTFQGRFIKIITNTGEHIDPDITFSDMINGEVYGKVDLTGSYVYVLQNSQPEDIKWIRVLIDPPHDENKSEIGEPFDIRVDFQ